MKKLLLFAFLISMQFNAKSQSTGNCFNEWYACVQKYGAKPVADGTHDVIITIRKDENCQAILGKVDVKGGKIVHGTLMILLQDGNYEKPDRNISEKYGRDREAVIDYTILNGMSPSFMTSQDEQVNFFFYKSLNKTPKNQKVAPTPSELGF